MILKLLAGNTFTYKWCPLTLGGSVNPQRIPRLRLGFWCLLFFLAGSLIAAPFAQAAPNCNVTVELNPLAHAIAGENLNAFWADLESVTHGHLRTDAQATFEIPSGRG